MTRPGTWKWAALGTSLMVLGAAEQAYAVCGDGTKEVGEACDDGNDFNSDGCSTSCAVETGFTCQDYDPLAALNPDFETDPLTSGWELLAGGIDWLNGTADSGCMPAGHGTYSIDLNQLSQGLVAQTFTTVPGRKYGVQFLASANCIMVGGQSCSLTCTRTMAMGAAADTAADTLTDIGQPIMTAQYEVNGSPKAAGWERKRFEFTATSTATIIFFWGSDTAAAGPMIDDIAIPTSWCLANDCGNGQLDGGEACDDGNTTGGDGCSVDCTEVEVGYTCATPGVACTAPCGDAVRQPSEGCDDGGTTPGDGCAADCTVEAGWLCTEVPPSQTSTCTDVDLCAGVDCGEATCVEAAEESYVCECADGLVFEDGQCVVSNQCEMGYAFDGSQCVDIDECAAGPDVCTSGYCENTDGAYVCLAYRDGGFGCSCDATSAPAAGFLGVVAALTMLVVGRRRQRRS